MVRSAAELSGKLGPAGEVRRASAVLASPIKLNDIADD
jgi:hypothetical protein